MSKDEDKKSQLYHAIDVILKGDEPDFKFDEMYKLSYAFVLNKEGSSLYNKINELMDTRVKDILQTLENANDAGGDFLSNIFKAWTEFTSRTKKVSDVNMYLERVYVPKDKVPTIVEMGNSKFNNIVVTESIRNRLIESLKSAPKDIDVLHVNVMLSKLNIPSEHHLAQ